MRLSMRFFFAVGGKDGEVGNSLGRWVERGRSSGRLPKLQVRNFLYGITSDLRKGDLGEGPGNGKKGIERGVSIWHIHIELTPHQDAVQNPRLPRSLRALQAERERRGCRAATLST
jgi:hypothetical protein